LCTDGEVTPIGPLQAVKNRARAKVSSNSFFFI
jgi:hypothetical protein